MKRILACLIVCCLLSSVALAEAPKETEPVHVTLTVGDLVIPAALKKGSGSWK